MAGFSDMPHRFADYCRHAGVGKECASCRLAFDEEAEQRTVYGLFGDKVKVLGMILGARVVIADERE